MQVDLAAGNIQAVATLLNGNPTTSIVGVDDCAVERQFGRGAQVDLDGFLVDEDALAVDRNSRLDLLGVGSGKPWAAGYQVCLQVAALGGAIDWHLQVLDRDAFLTEDAKQLGRSAKQ